MKGKINNLWQTMTSPDFLPYERGLTRDLPPNAEMECFPCNYKWEISNCPPLSPAITNRRPLTALLYPTQGVITRTPRQHNKESEGNKRQVKLEKAIQPAHFSQMAQLPVAKAGTRRNFHD